MLKIIQIIPSLAKGGAERLVLDLCIELSKRPDIEIQLITFYEENKYKYLSKTIKHKIIKSSFIPSITGQTIYNITDLQAYIVSFKPDIIHTHLWEAELVSRQINYPKAIWISHFHDNMIQLKNTYFPTSKKDLIYIYEKHLATSKYKFLNNRFICISNDTFKYANKVLPKQFKNNIYKLPNAIDLNRFQNKKIKSNHQLKLINIGSFVEKKNQAFLIPIIKKLIDKNIPVQLHLLGDGKNRTYIMQLIEQNKLLDYIILHGNVNNVEEYLSKSDIYVHSAYYEPFGLVLLEAMAAGLPVVCLDGGGNRDIIENGKNGFIIKDQNVDEFVERILELHNNQKLYTEISTYAQQYAMQYDIKPYVDKLLEIYQKAPACTWRKSNEGK